MSRLFRENAKDGSPGFVVTYIEQLEGDEMIGLNFHEPHRRDESMVRFYLTRSEAASLIGKVAMLLARGQMEESDGAAQRSN